MSLHGLENLPTALSLGAFQDLFAKADANGIGQLEFLDHAYGVEVLIHIELALELVPNYERGDPSSFRQQQKVAVRVGLPGRNDVTEPWKGGVSIKNHAEFIEVVGDAILEALYHLPFDPVFAAAMQKAELEAALAPVASKGNPSGHL